MLNRNPTFEANSYDMGTFQLGKFSMGWGRGNDRFTRTPNQWFKRIFSWNQKEVWVTENMNEYEIYSTTPEVFVVFNRFAAMFSNGEFVHKRLKSDGSYEVVDNSEYVKLLNKPNPLQSGKEWLQECALHYLIYGNRITYPLFATRLSPIPKAINNLPPQHIKIKTTGKRWDQTTINGIVESYQLENCYESQGDKRVFMPTEIIHHRNVDPENPIRGISPLQALHMPISNIRGAYGFRNVNIVKRGGLGILSNEMKDVVGHLPVNTEDRNRIEKQIIEETHGIHNGMNTFMMLDGAYKWQHTAYPMSQMMLFEEITEDMKRIIDSINLNDNIFSREKGSTYANLIEGLKMAYQDGIIPFSRDFCNGLTSGLRLPEGEIICLDYSSVPALREDEVKESQIAERNSRAYANLVGAGFESTEARDIIYGAKQSL